MMRVGEVGDLVQEWVNLHGRQLPGFRGAYLSGGIATMPLDAPFATYRDVDLIVVLDSGTKSTDENLEVSYKGLMLEVGFIGFDEHRDAGAVLARPDRAGNLARTRILADPTGVLTPLQQEVARSYADRRWIVARCNAEKQAVHESLDAMTGAPIPHLRLLALVGAIFGMAGLMAVARLQVPTNRRALIGLRQMLEAEGRAELYAEVLNVCGITGLSSAQVEAYHRGMLQAFDRAVEVKRTPAPYSFKFEVHTRPYANEAIAELITAGYHREAAFYLALPYGGANAIIQNDAPEEEKPAVQAAFDRLLAALDLLRPHDWLRRVQRARELSAELSRVADARVAGYCPAT